MRWLTILLCALCSCNLSLQTSSKRVFFVGNSYTAWYSLPEVLRVLARSTGDTLYYDSNLIGGNSLCRLAGGVYLHGHGQFEQLALPDAG